MKSQQIKEILRRIKAIACKEAIERFLGKMIRGKTLLTIQLYDMGFQIQGDRCFVYLYEANHSVVCVVSGEGLAHPEPENFQQQTTAKLIFDEVIDHLSRPEPASAPE